MEDDDEWDIESLGEQFGRLVEAVNAQAGLLAEVVQVLMSLGIRFGPQRTDDTTIH